MGIRNDYYLCLMWIENGNHLLAQMLNLLRSLSKSLSNSAKSAEGKLREVSSAKSLGLILMAIIKTP